MRLSTWNIKFCGCTDIANICQNIDNTNSDIVALQEISKEQVEFIRRYFYNKQYQVVRSSGNCLLSRFPIETHFNISLNVGNNTAFRSALYTVIDHYSTKITVIITHLDHKYESSRLKQFNILKQYLPKIDIIMGDLNSLYQSDYDPEQWKRLTSSRLVSGIEPATSDVMDQITRLGFSLGPLYISTPYMTRTDYIAIKNAVGKYRVLPSIKEQLSDHNMVICDIQYVTL
jgi:endonuclease/exonuclease/phosphatase family metal-dependent hydrolase